MFNFYRLHINHRVMWLRRLVREFKWDMFEAKKFGCKPNVPWYKRTI